MKKISIKFFEIYRERTGEKETSIEIPDHTSVAELKHLVGVKYPSLKPYTNFMLVMINKEYAFNEDILPDRASVYLFPPIEGG